MKGQNKWWNGYQDEEHVILDDLDTGALGQHLRIWADRFIFLAQINDETRYIRPKTIVVTSLYSPTDPVFKWSKEMVAGIKRRFNIIHMQA